MKNNDGLENLFRNRLGNARMELRDGFWEDLQHDLLQAAPEADGETDKAEGLLVAGKRRFLSPRYYRVAAAASVVLILGAASAAFWHFSPKEEIRDAFDEVAVVVPQGNLMQDRVQETFPSIAQAQPSGKQTSTAAPHQGMPASLADGDDEAVSVRVSITITERHYGSQHPSNGRYYASQRNNNYTSATDNYGGNGLAANAGTDKGSETQAAAVQPLNHATARRALKAMVGTSLPKGDCSMPLTAGVTGEWKLGKSNVWLETGLQYNLLPMKGEEGRNLHTLSVPLKFNLTLLQAGKLDLYVSAGGAAEKCVAGAPDNSFKAEPVRLSAMAGLGVRYKLNDRIALFAEPSVSHSFDTDSPLQTLRTERPTNLNLLCGVRMIY